MFNRKKLSTRNFLLESSGSGENGEAFMMILIKKAE